MKADIEFILRRAADELPDAKTAEEVGYWYGILDMLNEVMTKEQRNKYDEQIDEALGWLDFALKKNGLQKWARTIGIYC